MWFTAGFVNIDSPQKGPQKTQKGPQKTQKGYFVFFVVPFVFLW
jgi:hypothetical protein